MTRQQRSATPVAMREPPRLRAQVVRLIQFWVPDVPSSEFAAEARRQSALVAVADRMSDGVDFGEAFCEDWNT